MIVGLGVEWLDVSRFEAAHQRFGERLEARVFTAGERAYAQRKARGHESLAVRLAAKLAARRALGGGSFGWHELEVVRRRGEAPQLRLVGRAGEAARKLGVTCVSLSLTHDAACCVGHVVLEASGSALDASGVSEGAS